MFTQSFQYPKFRKKDLEIPYALIISLQSQIATEKSPTGLSFLMQLVVFHKPLVRSKIYSQNYNQRF